MTEGVLLDTCAIIWFANDQPVSAQAEALFEGTDLGWGRLRVSAMSAWEIGMLIAKGRLPTTREATGWFQEFIARADAEVVPASPEILIASSFLPQPVHGDPTDRILIATAREHDLTIITRDRAILDYGAAGHVKVLAC